MKLTLPLKAEDGTWGKRTLDTGSSVEAINEELMQAIKVLRRENERLEALLEKRRSQSEAEIESLA